MVFVPVQIVPSAGALTFIWNPRPGKKREIHARARLAHGLLPGAHLARAAGTSGHRASVSSPMCVRAVDNSSNSDPAPNRSRYP